MDLPRTVWQFLDTQVLRSDYLLVDEPVRLQTQLGYELKLERLHTLCVGSGYITVRQAEQVRRALFSEAAPTGCPVALLLAQAYLPGCVLEFPADANDRESPFVSAKSAREVVTCASDPASASVLESAVGRLAGKRAPFRATRLEWNGVHYLLYLPPNVHSLLIDNDGALMAA